MVAISLLVVKMGPPFDYEIIYSLRRSSIRQRVLGILANNEPMHINEIARLCGISAWNVTGALMGSGNGFNKTCSLHALGLVEEVNDQNNKKIRVFRITERGIKFYKKLKPI